MRQAPYIVSSPFQKVLRDTVTMRSPPRQSREASTTILVGLFPWTSTCCVGDEMRNLSSGIVVEALDASSDMK